MAEFVDDLDESDEKVLVFTHGGSITALIFWILSCESRRDWRITVDNCSLTVVETDEWDRWTVGKVNDSLMED